MGPVLSGIARSKSMHFSTKPVLDPVAMHHFPSPDPVMGCARVEGQQWEEARFLPKELRTWLADNFRLDWGTIQSRQLSRDGTRKFLIQVAPEKVVESKQGDLGTTPGG